MNGVKIRIDARRKADETLRLIEERSRSLCFGDILSERNQSLGGMRVALATAYAEITQLQEDLRAATDANMDILYEEVEPGILLEI